MVRTVADPSRRAYEMGTSILRGTSIMVGSLCMEPWAISQEGCGVKMRSATRNFHAPLTRRILRSELPRATSVARRQGGPQLVSREAKCT